MRTLDVRLRSLGVGLRLLDADLRSLGVGMRSLDVDLRNLPVFYYNVFAVIIFCIYLLVFDRFLPLNVVFSW